MKIFIVLLSFSFSLFSSNTFASNNLPEKDCCPDGGNGIDSNNYVILAYKEGLNVSELNSSPSLPGKEFIAEISSGNKTLAKAEVKNQEGKTVWLGEIELNKGFNRVKLMTRELASGVYFLNLHSQYGNSQKAFVVK